ncbi:MAG: hypothetical protein ACP6IT_08875, partial [Candidatus Thorarchaeota archaeon]
MEFDRLRARLLVLASLPVLISASITSAVLRTGYIGRLIGSASEYTLTELLVQAVVSTVLGTLVVGALFWAMQKRAYGTRKIIVAMVVSPMLGFVSIFIGETFLLVMFKGTSSVLDAVVLIASLGVSMMAIALIVLDIVPPLIRNLFVAFYGRSRLDKKTERHVHEAPKRMLVPMVILAVLAVVGGYIGLPGFLHLGNAIDGFLEPVFADSMRALPPAESATTEAGLMAASVLAAAAGLLAAY